MSVRHKMKNPKRSVFKTIIFPALCKVNIKHVVLDLHDESIFYPLLFENYPSVYGNGNFFIDAFPRQFAVAFEFSSEI